MESGCRRHSIRQLMQETLYGTADAEDTLSDRRCRRHSKEQRMQKTLCQTGDAGDTLWNSGYSSFSIRQRL